MKFRSFFLTLAAGAAMVSCSSDEPAINGGADDVISGDTAYLTINLSDVGSIGGRAENDGNPDTNGELEFGSANEHAVTTARFYFFDKNGLFLTRGEAWNPSTDTSSPNIESMGKKIVVIKGIENNNVPKYMLTVINPPVGFDPVQGWTLEQTRRAIVGLYDADNHFVMTTTSFVDSNYDDFDNDLRGNIYGVNVLKPGDFQVQNPGSSIDSSLSPVEVYVERLAAKIQVSSKMEGTNGYYMVPVTVAGNDNNQNGTDQALTEVYIQFSKWGVNNFNEKSYITKDINAYMTTAPWTATGNLAWNSTDYHRSFWGQAYGGYDNAFVGTDKLTVKGYNQLSYDFGTGTGAANENVTDYTAYVGEFTDDVNNISENGRVLNAKVTSVIFKARAFEKVTKDGKTEYVPLDMVRYDGLLYRRAAFLDHILSVMNYNGQLNYYKADGTPTEKKETLPDGSTKITWTGKFKQMDATDLALDLADDATTNVTGQIIATTTLAAGGKYYTKVAGKDEFEEHTFSAADVATLKTNVEAFKGEAFNSGWMFYNIPVEHLIKERGVNNAVVTGNYGVVRNHWYNISVNQVLNLGQGVFNPGSGTETGEEIIPNDKDKDPKYYLNANVNILSWKIVTQSVDL